MMPARRRGAEILYYAWTSARRDVGDDPLDLYLSVVVQEPGLSRRKHLRANRSAFGADFIPDQRVPLVAHGGDDAQAAADDLFCELRQAPGSVHVLIDARQIGCGAEEFHLLP